VILVAVSLSGSGDDNSDDDDDDDAGGGGADVDGADGGNVGCKLMSKEPATSDAMFTDLIVNSTSSASSSSCLLSSFVAAFALVFTARCYASAVLAMGLCPCPSVRLSVCHKSEFY